MGNRHGGEKSTKEDKEEKRRKKKEKKARKKQKKKSGTVSGSDVDLDPESSQFSRADSESLVFHSAENLSPYLDASTRSEEGAACGGFYDNGHILSSKDFHDGFSIEACLPADLAAAASALSSDVSADVIQVGDDVTSMSSGVYGTPLLSSPDVRRGIPRSPMAQRQKDSFVEPVPPIPSDFSSNTLSSVSYQEGVSTPGTQRSSSRASSSTVDTNAAHCIERLEELERNIERTIIEKFAGASSENTTPRLVRRDFGDGEGGSREGSVTPKGMVSSDGALGQSPQTSPTAIRKISEPCRPTQREGSSTPQGLIQGLCSQSAENSPVIVRKALPSPESPIILRRTPSQSPSVERKFPANAPESPVFYRRAMNVVESPGLSPLTQRRTPADSQERSPQLVRREVPGLLEQSGVGTPQKKKIPPPVPPKPVMKTLTSPEIARRLQNMPKSPIMARKVYAFQEQAAKDKSAQQKEDPWDRAWREHQMPPRSPSRSPEVRHRVPRKTPSSSPSPKSLIRKLMPQEDRAPPPPPPPPPPAGNVAPSPLTHIQFCQQQKGIPVKHCTVAAQPSAAVVLNMGQGEDPATGAWDDSNVSAGRDQSHVPLASQDRAAENTSQGAVLEDSIRRSTETAVFGSVSPKLKRQRKIHSGDDSSQSSSFDHQRGDSTDSSTRSPPCSPPLQRGRPLLAQTPGRQGSDHSPVSGDGGDGSPVRRRARFQKQLSKCREDGALSADIAGGLTYHSRLSSEEVTSGPHSPRGDRKLPPAQRGHDPVSSEGATRAGPQGGPFLDRRGVEGQCDTMSGSSAVPLSHTTLSPEHSTSAPDTTPAPTERSHSQSALIAGSTVAGKNARDLAAAAAAHNTEGGREQQHGTASVAREEGEEGGEGHSRACWSRERNQPQQLLQPRGAAAVPAPCQRVPSPPSLPAAGSATTSGSGSSGSSSSSAQPACKNLGQRIRDVIHESSFREVFTAELSSSSSVEREDGGTYTSDDSAVGGSGHGARGVAVPLAPPSRPHWPPSLPPERTDPHHALPSSPLSSPTPPRSARGPCVAVGTAEAHKITPARSSNPPQPPSEPLNHPVTLPLSSPLDSTAIRRIDIDVNVILPQGEETQEGAGSATTHQRAPISDQCETDGGQGTGGVMDRETGDVGQEDPGRHNLHSSRGESGARGAPDQAVGAGAKREQADLAAAPVSTPEKTTKPPPAVMAETQGRAENIAANEAVKNASDHHKKGEKRSKETARLNAAAPPASLPASAPSFQTSFESTTTTQPGERSAEGEKTAAAAAADSSCFVSESKSRTEAAISVGQEGHAAGEVQGSTDPPHPSVPVDSSVLAVQNSQSVLSSQPITASREPSQTTQAQAHHVQCQNGHQAGAQVREAHPPMTDVQPTLQDNVPPPSPTAMDTLAEEEEEEEEEEGEDVNCMINAHHDSDISTKISQEMQLFGETVVKRLSSLLESQASESDSCLEEGKADLLTVPSRPRRPEDGQSSALPGPEQQHPAESSSRVDAGEGGAFAGLDTPGTAHHFELDADSGQGVVVAPSESGKEDVEPVLHEELNTFAASDLPGERLVTSDTTETLSTDHETSASSKRESTASTATDETLTSFKTRSTTDSAEFEDAFVLPESLVFVRSVNEDRDRAVVEKGRIIKRPPIPAELTRHSAAAVPESPSHKPRKKRRRPVATYDVSTRADVTEPEPKRGSKQIQDVIDAYCEEMSSDDSDISSSSTDDILKDELAYRTTYSRSEQEPRLPPSLDRDDRPRDVVRKPKPPADRSTDSSDDSGDLEAKRRSSSSHDSSFRIPEIEETFGELMGVKTFLDDLEDQTPTSERPPAMVGEEKAQAKESLPSALHHRRRSKTSPARTDRTESDLDVSEHRDDASTDSMYADDEDEGAELVFQRSYSEEHGGEVVLSCTIYNSAHDNDADSDDFWADAEAAAAGGADDSYKTLETAADAAGSAFQNARIQMHDIHQHLQDLRRQMELLQDDITSTSLTLTPEFSLESEQRPVTE